MILVIVNNAAFFDKILDFFREWLERNLFTVFKDNQVIRHIDFQFGSVTYIDTAFYRNNTVVDPRSVELPGK